MDLSINARIVAMFICFVAVLCHPMQERTSEIVYPERIDSQRNKRDLSTKTDNGHEDNVSYKFEGLGRVFIIDLKRNKGHHASTIVVRTFDKENKAITEYHTPESCHYHGIVRGYINSSVILSTYEGKLRCAIDIDQEIFNIEPTSDAENKYSHILYIPNEDDPCKDAESCDGISMPKPDDDVEITFQPKIFNRTRRSLPSLKDLVNLEPQYTQYITTAETRYAETFAVVDFKLFEFYNNNTVLVMERVLNLFNAVDRSYQAINIRIVLVGIEIWTNGDQMTRHTTGGPEISAFRTHCTNMPQWNEVDNFQFLSRYPWSDSAGMAYVGGMCEPSSKVGINSWSPDSITGPLTIVGHEMGHNFNFKHDGYECNCLSDNGCFMGGSKGRRPGFSNCSLLSLAKKSFSCLNNYPQSPITGTCGNGIVEGNEICDCGTEEMCLNNDPCCMPGLCVLKPNAQCSDASSGSCCSNCILQAQGTICRATSAISNGCDVNEYCDGISGHCPADDYFADGTPCSDRRVHLNLPTAIAAVTTLFEPPIAARYLKIVPADNQGSSQPCIAMEILGTDANEAVGAVATPLRTGEFYYSAPLCVTPDITSCSDTSDAVLKFKTMPNHDCNHDYMQFKLETTGVLRHVCTNKVVCPGTDSKLYIKTSCTTADDDQYDRLASRVVKHRNSGKCWRSQNSYPINGKYIYLSSTCNHGPEYQEIHFLIPDRLMPTGMETGTLPDSGFYAKAATSSNKASDARIRVNSGYCFTQPNNADYHLEVDFGKLMSIGGISIENKQSTTSKGYYLQYSSDNVIWKYLRETNDPLQINSYCYLGQCAPTLDTQCKYLWDTDATSAVDECYNDLNTIPSGREGYGTCDPNSVLACSSSNVKCGQLQCSSTKTSPLRLDYGMSYAAVTLPSSTICSNSAFNIHEKAGDASGEGVAETGTKCGSGKVCNSQRQCVDSATLYPNNCPLVNNQMCAGRGFCKNTDVCFCQSGYDPATHCDTELVAQDGGISDWSEWSPCSMNCGGGVRYHHRHCNSPLPMHGGADCTEELSGSEACNIESCPDGYSCHSILKVGQAAGLTMLDGVYTIKLPDQTTMSVYCDMTRDGGGWTLLVASYAGTWSAEEILERNKENPDIIHNYSILEYADQIKGSYFVSSTTMEYRIEGQERGRWGGIWEAPSSYSFKQTDNTNIDVILKLKFDNWDETLNSNLVKRMPYINGAYLSTGSTAGSGVYGSIIDSQRTVTAARWLQGSMVEDAPERIWYWMREGYNAPPKSCREIKLNGFGHETSYPDGVYLIRTETGSFVKTYCDMNRHGGGWTLIAAVPSTNGFTSSNILMRKQLLPSLTTEYSIIGQADHIKNGDPAETHYQYMIEADGNDLNGGIFSAPVSSNIVGASDAVQPTLLKQFGTWDLTANLAKYTPRVVDTSGRLVAAASNVATDSSGVLIKEDGNTATYLPGVVDNPSILRMWIREAGSRKSCNDIKIHGEQHNHVYADGFYTIKNGVDSILHVYCDMTSDPGAWTLLVTSRHNSWTSAQVLSRNENMPSIGNDYSILSHADGMRDLSASTHFKYKLAANQFNHWGGIFTAPKSYSFVSTSNANTEVTLDQQFDTWTFDSWQSSVCKRMPWVSTAINAKALLTTSESDDQHWQGSIISGVLEGSPAKWITPEMDNPNRIWYFINEDDCDVNRVAVAGGFTPWSLWSECRPLCVPQTVAKRRRTRSCTSPTPKCGGAVCNGDVELEESCTPSCPTSVIKTKLADFCLVPQTGGCTITTPTPLVWKSALAGNCDQPGTPENEFVFDASTGLLLHKCSMKLVCPENHAAATGNELRIDASCPLTNSAYFTRTHEDQLSYGNMCLHPLGSQPVEGAVLQTHQGCLEARLVMKFTDLPSGKVTAKYYMGLTVGSPVTMAALYANPNFIANTPTSEGTLDNMATPSSVGDSYGMTMSSLFVAPQTGSYIFHTACHDVCELSLSTNHDHLLKKVIVQQTAYSDMYTYDTYPAQSSLPVSLIVGQLYYIEASMVDQYGGDHLSVAVTLPDGNQLKPITQHYLTDSV